MRTSLALGAALLSALAAACATGGGPGPSTERAPRRRSGGPRCLDFAGGDPGEKGWAKVDGLWVREADADAFRKGLVRCGDDLVPLDDADRIGKTPEDGYVLRTDHVLVRTDVAFRRAADLARTTEAHVVALLDSLGGPLDLRSPADPLPVVVAAHRRDFDALLARKVAEPSTWGAFYAAAEGTVYACDEPLGAGGLPVVADLRHETTHAVLDLGRPARQRDRMFDRPHFWAWEGIAMWAESLRDPPGHEAGAERLARFRRRAAWGDVVPLEEVFALPQRAFLGRHYDETAAFTRWLLAPEGGGRRDGFLRLLSRVMDGDAEAGDFERFVGWTPDEAERRWKASMGG
ncbi:MAG: hypothetical protein IT460_07990 [Planctomycetes bacterium]|nr:hypothetical protein [Planctomycetota bacterium]